MAGPIKPEDVGKAKAALFPPEVFEAFNEIITQEYDGGSATVKQSDVVKRMVEKGLNLADIHANGWLNVEDAYRAAGWSVTYDKPGWDESYPANFKFKKKRRQDD